jgi:hypothetical protein
MGWQEGDSAVYVYDRYDVWKIKRLLQEGWIMFQEGRKMKTSYRYRLDRIKNIDENDGLLCRVLMK